MEKSKAFFTHEEAPDGQCPTKDSDGNLLHGGTLLDMGHSEGKLYCPNQQHDGRREQSTQEEQGR